MPSFIIGIDGSVGVPNRHDYQETFTEYGREFTIFGYKDFRDLSKIETLIERLAAGLGAKHFHFNGRLPFNYLMWVVCLTNMGVSNPPFSAQEITLNEAHRLVMNNRFNETKPPREVKYSPEIRRKINELLDWYTRNPNVGFYNYVVMEPKEFWEALSQRYNYERFLPTQFETMQRDANWFYGELFQRLFNYATKLGYRGEEGGINLDKLVEDRKGRIPFKNIYVLV